MATHFFSNCGQRQNQTKKSARQPRIVSGQDVPLSRQKHPWFLLLNSCNHLGQHCAICGGSVVSYQYALTAAHCIPSNRHYLIDLYVDVHTFPDCTDPHFRVGSNYQEYLPPGLDSHVIYYPGYDLDSLRNDLALIRIDGDFNYRGARDKQ